MILIISYTVCKKVQVTLTYNKGEKYIFIPKKVINLKFKELVKLINKYCT